MIVNGIYGGPILGAFGMYLRCQNPKFEELILRLVALAVGSGNDH